LISGNKAHRLVAIYCIRQNRVGWGCYLSFIQSNPFVLLVTATCHGAASAKGEAFLSDVSAQPGCYVMLPASTPFHARRLTTKTQIHYYLQGLYEYAGARGMMATCRIHVSCLYPYGILKSGLTTFTPDVPAGLTTEKLMQGCCRSSGLSE
jgi:hypothetical protein